MGLLNKLFGHRWSLYIVKDGELMYVMHENSVMRIVGYIMTHFSGTSMPKPPWKLYLNFNKSNKLIELHHKYFNEDGSKMSRDFVNKISSIDPNYKVKGNTPIFIDVKENKKIPLSSTHDLTNLKALIESNEPYKKETTFFEILNNIFNK